MSGYQDSQGQIIDEGVGSKTKSFTPLIVSLSIAFAPGMILAWVAHLFFFRKKKQKPKVIVFIAFLMGLFLFIINQLFWHPIQNIIANPNLKNGIWLYLWVCFIFGIVIFLVMTLWYARQLKNYPELKVMSGWANNFEYLPSPFDKWLKKQLIKSCREGREYSEEGAPLGVLDDKVYTSDSSEFLEERPEIVTKYYTEARTHTLVTGSSGSGKTVSVLNMVYNDILTSKPVIFIDCKAAVDVVYFLSKWAKENDREFYHFSAGPQETYYNPFYPHKTSYDPLSSGDSTYKTDLLLNLRKYDMAADVYKGRARAVLQTVTGLLEKTNPEDAPQIPWNEGGLAQVSAALEPHIFQALLVNFENNLRSRSKINYFEKNVLKGGKNLLAALTKAKDEDGLSAQAKGYRSLLNGLLLSSYGEWLTVSNSQKMINLNKMAIDEKGPVVLFSLSPLAGPDFARHLGNIILGNLSQVADSKQKMSNPPFTSLYIDEFQMLNVEAATGLLEQARSAKIGVTLALQSLDQITATGEFTESMIQALMETVGSFLVHAGLTEGGAERYSKLIGNYEKKIYSTSSRKHSGMFSINWSNARNALVSTRTEEDWIVPPSELQQLSKPTRENDYKATAYYLTKSSDEKRYSNNRGVLARKLHAVVFSDITAGVPKQFEEQFNEAVVKDTVLIENIDEITFTNEEEIDGYISDSNFKIEPIEEKTDISDDIGSSQLDLYQKQYKRERPKRPESSGRLPKLD